MYLLSARKFSAKGQKPSLDLSRLRHIFNAVSCALSPVHIMMLTLVGVGGACYSCVHRLFFTNIQAI